VADSFIRVTLRDGSTQNVVVPADVSPSGVVEALAKGQPWPQRGGAWIEVEGGGAVTRRLVAADQIVSVELFERG
jgi:hypothetical protein